MVMSIGQRRLCQILAVSSFGVWGYSVAAAQEVRSLPELTAGRLTDGEEGPEIDGRVDETLWSAAQPYSTFTQQEPNEGQPASEQTEIRFLIDPQNLYIGVISFDASQTSSLSARAVGMPISTIPTPSRYSSTRSTTGRTLSSSAPIPSGSRTTGR